MTEVANDEKSKPILSFWRILLMNFGFLGLQFSFGLQQGNMGPIYSYLGASQAVLPLLNLAGPVTGLLVQPLIGALSDRTRTRWGRRVPYFIVGAIICSLCLFAMPYSGSIAVAAALLWILVAANNVTMEPYRAYVSDRLSADQRELGFLTQSSFTGLAQTLAYAAPAVLVILGVGRNAVAANGIPVVTHIVFVIGAVVSISTILWSVLAVPELPAPPVEARHSTFGEIFSAIREMPGPMRRMGLMSLFQWYAMSCYWGYVIYSISETVYDTNIAASSGFRSAVLTNGDIGAFYNLIAAVAAYAMVPVSRRFGPDKVHALCLVAAGLTMLAIPFIHDRDWLFVAAIGVGLGWGSIMGNPYVMLADSIPAARTGVYMGIFNMFIVIPMILFSITMPLIYSTLFHDHAPDALLFGGVLMFLAAGSTMLVRPGVRS
ncbi:MULTISPECIES: MFS transporter [unclassified Acidiphilium]|uniref:MFS transporter n=1 Tax=unclassified Acidiphilium TaxID=2617493 RepID=UPI0025BD6A26|nr:MULTISPECIES: MFS transporter [unclassified Acidiphilium]HQT61526.1 MFS transporter [Acidiphilium sp.]